MEGAAFESTLKSEQPTSSDDIQSRDVVDVVVEILLNAGPDAVHLSTVARQLGRSLGDVEEMFGRQEYLIAQYMRSVFALLFSFTRFEEYTYSPAHATMRLAVWLEPETHVRRRALLESQLESVPARLSLRQRLMVQSIETCSHTLRAPE